MNSALRPVYNRFAEVGSAGILYPAYKIFSVLFVGVCVVAMLTVGCSKARKDAISVLNKGVVALDQGAPNSAYDFFLEASHIDPSFAEAFYHLGLVQYHERQELHAARDSLNQAVTLEIGRAHV